MEELRNKFREACAYYSALAEVEKKIDAHRATVTQMERTRDTEKEKACGSTFSSVVKVIPWAIGLPAAGLIVTFGLYLLCVAGMLGMDDASIGASLSASFITLVILFGGVGVSALLEIVPWIWWLTIGRKKQREKREAFLEEWQSLHGGEYENALKQIDVLLKARADYITERQAVLEFLPAEYRDGIAVTYMAKLLRDNRASDLKEALGLYDQQLHRWKLEGALKTEAAKRDHLRKTLEELK